MILACFTVATIYVLMGWTAYFVFRVPMNCKQIMVETWMDLVVCSFYGPLVWVTVLATIISHLIYGEK